MHTAGRRSYQAKVRETDTGEKRVGGSIHKVHTGGNLGIKKDWKGVWNIGERVRSQESKEKSNRAD